MPQYPVLTHLDGTFLDHTTCEWGEALPALSECLRRKVPVVPVSSETRAEIQTFRGKMGLTSPFISENGGGVFIPAGILLSPPEGLSKKATFGNYPLGFPMPRL
jgi:mannosyl-3-phosphoglycerate phosphatase